MTMAENLSTNTAWDITLHLKKIISYQKSLNTSVDVIKSILEEEYLLQTELLWEKFNKLYLNISEQDKHGILHIHYSTLDKLDLAYANAQAKLNN